MSGAPFLDPTFSASALAGYHGTVHKFGRNGAVTGNEAIWSAGGVYTGWLTAASAVRVKAGGNAADVDTTGAGARTITVVGLDENFVEAEEDISLKGVLVSDPTTTTFIRVFRAFVKTCGTYGDNNTGDIDIETTGGDLMAQITADQGQTQMAIYCVPAGKTAFLVRWSLFVDSTQSSVVRICQRAGADNTSAPFDPMRIVKEAHGASGPVENLFQVYPQFAEKTDIWIDATRLSGGTTEVDATFDLILVNN